jgi:hypothetical protein
LKVLSRKPEIEDEGEVLMRASIQLRVKLRDWAELASILTAVVPDTPASASTQIGEDRLHKDIMLLMAAYTLDGKAEKARQFGTEWLPVMEQTQYRQVFMALASDASSPDPRKALESAALIALGGLTLATDQPPSPK